MEHEQTVGEAGEKSVLQAVLGELRGGRAIAVGPGDDAAVLHNNGNIVVTSDTMIEGPDFCLDWHTGTELGWKLAAVNLSDVAAMGATPTALTVSLACPKDTPVRLLQNIATGLQQACDSLAPGCAIAGGDLATAPVLIGAVTAIGDLDTQKPILRSGARPGDVISYAGDLGLSGLGLALLSQSTQETACDLRQQHRASIAAHLTPDPPLHLGPQAAYAGATAMMDVSDGLSLDAARLAIASSVVINFDSGKLRHHFEQQSGEHVSLEFMLTGGEDHGLLATFPPDVSLPDGFHLIGVVDDAESSTERSTQNDRNHVFVDGEPFTPRGWDPFTTV